MTIFLTQMQDFAALNQIYMRVFENVHPKPARTCVAVSALPMGTDVEMECVASL